MRSLVDCRRGDKHGIAIYRATSEHFRLTVLHLVKAGDCLGQLVVLWDYSIKDVAEVRHHNEALDVSTDMK